MNIVKIGILGVGVALALATTDAFANAQSAIENDVTSTTGDIDRRRRAITTSRSS